MSDWIPISSEKPPYKLGKLNLFWICNNSEGDDRKKPTPAFYDPVEPRVSAFSEGDRTIIDRSFLCIWHRLPLKPTHWKPFEFPKMPGEDDLEKQYPLHEYGSESERLDAIVADTQQILDNWDGS